jgi:hypothetical protein
MNSQQQMDERLWDFIDGLSSPGERSAIEGLIAANREWTIKYHELLELHQTMVSAELEEPSLRFSKNVMEEIARYHVAPATKSYINKNIIRAIGAFFLVTIAGLLVYCLGHWFGANQGVEEGGITGTSADMIAKYGHVIQHRVDSFNWSGIFNNTYVNIFVVVNMILGLMLLDMYMTRRRRQGSHQ